ncbi:MAG: CehA/McbA family metallohydrolase, partial [Bacillota bacterium]
ARPDPSGGIWAAWLEIGDSANVSYWVRYYDGETWLDPVMIGRFRRWRGYLDLVVDLQGNAYLLYNYGNAIHLRRVDRSAGVTGPVQVCSGERFNRRPSATLDEHGNMWVAWQSAPANGHVRARNAEIWVKCIPLDALQACQNARLETRTESFIEAPYRRRVLDVRESTEPLTGQGEGKPGGGERPADEFRVFWGDPHGQSELSDGLGHVDQYFNAARVLAKTDFCSLTDHDAFPEVRTESEWTLTVVLSNLFNAPGRFATLLGFEWTSNEFKADYGHRNVYFAGVEGQLLRCADESCDNPGSLYEALRKHNAVVIPHHPAADWGMVSAAVDWQYHDPALERCVEIVSVHAPFEYYGNRSPYTKNVPQMPGRSAQDALGLGYRLGFMGGSDTHQCENGREGGLTAVLAGALNRESVFDAIQRRRVYATTGARILLNFTLNGVLMGEEISLKAGATVRLAISVTGTDDLRSVEIIKDGVVLWGGTPNSRTFKACVEDREKDGYHGTRYY